MSAGSMGAAEYPNQAGGRAPEPAVCETPSTRLAPAVPVAALRALKRIVWPMHGHSTCAADPEVVLWEDLAALCDAAEQPEHP